MIGQIVIPKTDSVLVKKDTTILRSANDDIKSKITYQAEDSIVYDMNTRKMYLYNKSSIDYTDLHIDAYYIDYEWNSGELAANQKKLKEDSILGKPYMKQDGKEYYSHKMRYSFKSKQGKVYDIVTQEGESLLHGHEVKKDSQGNWFISQAKYTTCDLEHPHFYFNSNKIKLTTKKSIVTGPANIVIADIKTPIYLPFGIYPTNKGRRSGIILPQQYGFSPVFNLQNMGYYWGINDNLDATFLTDIFFNGSYRYGTNIRYNKLYKYDGNFTFNTHKTFLGDADDPKVVDNTPTNYLFHWVHRQSEKAHPTFRFNSDIQYLTSGAYNQSLDLSQRRITGQITSTINAYKKFRNSPFQLSAGVNYNQNLATQTISGSAPTLNLRYYGTVFKLKNSPNSFLNNINLDYNTEFSMRVDPIRDSVLLANDIFRFVKSGIKHEFNFNLGNIKLFKYLNLSPTISYFERQYFKKNFTQIENNKITYQGFQNEFNAVRSVTGNLSLNTTIVGTLPFSKKGMIKALRHQMTPAITLGVSPNYSTNFWGYYTQFDTFNTTQRYYPYESIYGEPGTNANTNINFSLSNSIEGKFRNKKDSINKEKKMRLLDVFNLNTSYNLALDSFRMTNIGISFNNSTLGFLTFNGGLTYDPYLYKNGKRIDRYKIIDGDGLLKFINFNASVNLNLSSNNFSKKVLASSKGTEFERDYIYRNYQYFYDFDNPWNLQLSFTNNLNSSFNKSFKDTLIHNASINVQNFDFNLTKNWKIGISTGYDFNVKQLGITTISAIRNMHCWEFRFNYTPISIIGQSYLIELRPKSALLQDLKITRNKPAIENFF